MTLTESTTTTATPTGFTLQALEELSRRRQEPEWLLGLRRDAFAAYERIPLEDQPTGNWRRTNLAGLDLGRSDQLVVTDAPSTTPASLEGQASFAGVLSQQDGAATTVRLDPDLARRGVRLLSLDEALRDAALAERVRAYLGGVVELAEDKLTALHYALLNGGVVVFVPRGVAVDRPFRVDLAYSTPGLAAFTHTLIVLEENAELAYLESYGGDSDAAAPIASGAVEVVLGPNARLRYVNLQQWGDQTWSFSYQRARLAADSHFRTLNVALGARQARNTIQALLDGTNCQADLLGCVFGSGRRHFDFQTLQDHFGSGTRSDLVIHNALDDRSSSNFTGLIRIEKLARGTESSQEQKNYLLSDRARADSDPKLEILNNDVVRCTHGAAVGPVDPELIYYLQSRGLDRQAAEGLVLEGFFRSVLRRLEHPELEVLAWTPLQARLGLARLVGENA